ncbi:MAG: hypothetical protein HKL90_12670 [Elusimicrobia bacterium]|nr:hypothetical protein [Elusimicrobiota bacterium]
MNTPAPSRSKSLPAGWVKAPVGKLFQVLGGGTPPTSRTEFWTGGIPWISSADIGEDHKITPRRKITKAAISASATNLVPAGSAIVVTRVGLGKVGLAEQDLCFSQDNHALIFDRNRFDSKFVVLQMGQLVSVFKCISRGTTINGVTKKQLLDVEFLAPPLPEQRRIVAEIEKQFARLEVGVAALRRLQVNLKRYRAAVLKAACEGRLVPTEAELTKTGNRKTNFETGKALLARTLIERRQNWQGRGQYKEPAFPDTANLLPLPEGWAWARAEQLCEFITKGTTPAAEKMRAGEGEVPFIKVYNLTFTGVLNLDYKPVFISRKTHELELTRSEVRTGDILINIVGPPLGQVAIIPTTIKEANINQAIARFRVVLPECQRLLALYLRTEQIIGWAMKSAKTTAGQSNITLELCRDLPVPLPPLAEQTRIVAEVERRLSVLEELEAAVSANLQRATHLRQSILQQAFAGRLTL